MQYFLLGIPEIGQLVNLEGDEGHHLTKVKRCDLGEVIKLFDGNGIQASAEVMEINKRNTVLKIISRLKLEPAIVKTKLFIVPPKGKNFPLLLEKAVEIGVDEIFPITSERSIKEYQIEKETKYEKILLEASKQCERAYLPHLFPLMSLSESLSSFDGLDDLKLFFHTNGGGNHWEQARNLAKGSSCCFWIGPEGGWADNEIVLARTKGVLVCTLPMPILRVETAVIAISSLLKTYLP